MKPEKIIDEINLYGGAIQVRRRAQVAEENRRENLNEGERQIEDEQNIEQFDKLYDALLDESGFDNNDLNRNLLKKKLNVKPLKDKFTNFQNGWIWSADTKVFGQDILSTEAIALLVCVDTSTRRCDAQPVIGIDQINAIPAMRTILDRHIIQNGYPKIIYTDQGGEFGQNFTRFLNQWGLT